MASRLIGPALALVVLPLLIPWAYLRFYNPDVEPRRRFWLASTYFLYGIVTAVLYFAYAAAFESASQGQPPPQGLAAIEVLRNRLITGIWVVGLAGLAATAFLGHALKSDDLRADGR